MCAAGPKYEVVSAAAAAAAATAAMAAATTTKKKKKKKKEEEGKTGRGGRERCRKALLLLRARAIAACAKCTCM